MRKPFSQGHQLSAEFGAEPTSAGPIAGSIMAGLVIYGTEQDHRTKDQPK